MRKIFRKITTFALFATGVIPMVALTSSCSTSKTNSVVKSARFATFNVSFATDNDNTENYQRWYDFMALDYDQQNAIIDEWKVNNGIATSDFSEQEKSLAERIMQIRNIAAIIQHQRPDVLSLNEFNNDGKGNNEIIELFQKNYLAHGQSLNGVHGGDIQKPIYYPYYESFATNTGYMSGMDLDNDGIIGTNASSNPNDAFGFGYYHGHYAIAVLSKYELDTKNARTFQNFKFSDMRNENDEQLTNSTVTVQKDANVYKYDENGSKTGETWKAGDSWYTDQEWKQMRLSSKNHIDIPVIINNKKIHLLLSHPTPPNFNTLNGVATDAAMQKNKYEILFWQKYINNASWIYDDNNNYGGIDGTKENFVIMGDLNADCYDSDNSDANIADKNAYRYGIKGLISDKLINQDVVLEGDKVPTSQGAYDAYNDNASGNWAINNQYNHPKIEAITSTFGLKADWVLPNKNLHVIDSQTFWVGQNETGNKLFVDEYGGKVVKTKYVSSDHRMVWADIKLV